MITRMKSRPDNVVVILVVAGIGRDTTNPQIEREDDLAGSFHPGGRLGEDTPVRGKEVRKPKRATTSQTGADGEGDHDQETGRHTELANISNKLYSSNHTEECNSSYN